MDERVRSLMNDWNKHQGHLKESAEQNLEFHYESREKQKKERRGQIIDVLALWSFVNRFMGRSEDWEIRRSFLAHFTTHSNPMIRVIAMAESLPTSVWRKIIWKHNIDFMSFESFLRRLEEKQIKAIDQNYEDLFVAEEVPRVFSRSERFFRRITVEKLLGEDFNGEIRYSRKAAMSFNLLNLDFGFNAYPKGVGSDEKVEEISPLKFISVKNHADDFVVNQENGKYWWLYRKARSNYVWRPNREVKIKTHICPGFWYTLLVHFVFWILSPLAFVGAIAHGFSDINWWVAGPVGAVGLIMPLWLTLAGLKLLFTVIAKAGTALINSAFTEQMDESVVRWFKRNKNIISNCFMGVGFAAAAFIVLLFAVLLFWLLRPDLGAVGAIATIAMIFAYLGYGVSHSEYKFTIFKDFPLYLKIPIMFVVFCLVYKFLLIYQAIIISGIFVFVFFLELLAVLVINIAKTVFLHLMSAIVLFGIQKFAVITAAVGIPIVIVAILHYLPEEKQKKFYDVLGNSLWYGLGTYLSLSALILVYWLIAYSGVIGTVFVILFALYGAGAWYLFFYSSPYVKESRWIARHVYIDVDFRDILENKWLLSLGVLEAREKLLFVHHILGSIFNWEKKYHGKAARWIAPFISSEVIQRLENHQQTLIKIKNYDLRLMVVKVLVSQDIDFESAIKSAKKEMAERKEREMLKAKKDKKLKEQIRAIGIILYIVFFAPIQFFKLIAAILRGVWFAIKKLGEYIMTLRRLWELFNERCPYITEQKVLRFK